MDFFAIDHLALVAEPLDALRDRFGVMAPADPNDGHHIFWN
jgi:hypothetical protein